MSVYTMIFAIVAIAIISSTIIQIVSMVVESKPRKSKKSKGQKIPDEDIAELSRRCKELNTRIQALETIIIENESNSKSTTHD